MYHAQTIAQKYMIRLLLSSIWLKQTQTGFDVF